MKVGVIGIGIMGSAIARNCVKAGHSVVGFDILPERCQSLAQFGAEPLNSAAEIATAADVVLTSLATTAALDETTAALASIGRNGQIVCELSTFPIEVKQRNRDILAGAGIVMLDCPLSGTGAQAVNADLAVFASGEATAYEKVKPVFAGFTRVSHFVGDFGNGMKMKVVANLLVAVHNVAAAEAMVLGMKAGLDPETIVRVVSTGGGTSRAFELRAPLMAANSYDPPTMKNDVWQKDMAIIANVANTLGVAAPLFFATVPLYNAVISQGFGGKDTAAVCAVLEQMAGLHR